MNTQNKIAEVCDGIKKLLLDKNKKYGNSALEPVRVFSKASPVEQLLVPSSPFSCPEKGMELTYAVPILRLGRPGQLSAGDAVVV